MQCLAADITLSPFLIWSSFAAEPVLQLLVLLLLLLLLLRRLLLLLLRLLLLLVCCSASRHSYRILIPFEVMSK